MSSVGGGGGEPLYDRPHYFKTRFLVTQMAGLERAKESFIGSDKK